MQTIGVLYIFHQDVIADVNIVLLLVSTYVHLLLSQSLLVQIGHNVTKAHCNNSIELKNEYMRIN